MLDNKANKNKGAILLRDVPEDLRQFIIKENARMRLKRGINTYSLGKTIYQLLREYMNCRAETNFKP